MPLHKVTCMPRGHALGIVSGHPGFLPSIYSGLTLRSPATVSFQTSRLPEDDRVSISMKEFLADIDVAMGGRVAEELSEPLLLSVCLVAD